EHARGTAAVAVRAVERDLVRGLLCGAAAGHEQDRAAAGRTGPALRLPQSEHLVRVRLGGLLSRGLGTAAPSGSRTDRTGRCTGSGDRYRPAQRHQRCSRPHGARTRVVPGGVALRPPGTHTCAAGALVACGARAAGVQRLRWLGRSCRDEGGAVRAARAGGPGRTGRVHDRDHHQSCHRVGLGAGTGTAHTGCLPRALLRDPRGVPAARAGRGTACPVAGTGPDAARAPDNARGAGLARSSSPHSRSAVVVGPPPPAKERGHAGCSLTARWYTDRTVIRRGRLFRQESTIAQAKEYPLPGRYVGLRRVLGRGPDSSAVERCVRPEAAINGTLWLTSQADEGTLTMDEAAVRSAPLFAELSDDSYRAVRERTTELTFRRGEEIFHEGSQGDRLFVIGSGKVKLGHM